jgi:uncharacterized oxidoreductase
MKMTQNTILITGGGSGIGRALAEAFHRLGNKVVIAGRSKAKLDETTAANPGMKSVILDIAKADTLRLFAARTASEYPTLNVVVQCAGIMVPEDFLKPEDSPAADEATIATNLLGPIRLTTELLPLLRKQPHSTVMTVSSGLGFVPMAMCPTYSATKAAIHSYSESLRYQLRETNVEVLEIIPPYVATTLTGERQATDPRAMPLNEFIAETMEILKTQPTPTEILVKRVHPLRFAAANGQEKYAATFKGFNDSITQAPTAHNLGGS